MMTRSDLETFGNFHGFDWSTFGYARRSLVNYWKSWLYPDGAQSSLLRSGRSCAMFDAERDWFERARERSSLKHVGK